MTANIITHAPGQLSLLGSINFSNVDGLYRNALLNLSNSEIVVDLSEIQQSDSAGLAFLVAWFKEAEKKNIKLSFVNPPEHLLALARESCVEQLFDSEM